MFVLVVFVNSVLTGCFESEKGEPYYGRVETPRAQEFRWSDGGLPHVFDPALAAAPPDTDVVRALFEGLTDNDPASLEPVAAMATKWEASPDYRSWTFHLRRGARWSNGDEVTAKDFVRSWQRTLRLGERAPHVKLLGNIEGAQSAVALVAEPTENNDDAPAQATNDNRAQATPTTQPAAKPAPPAPSSGAATANDKSSPPADAATFGAQAVGDYVLKVRLKRPDVNFPSLVAHPVFRPVHEVASGSEAGARSGDDGAQGEGTTQSIVSNGAFRLSGRAADSVLLERASNYWDAGAVALERVRFVSSRDGEAALNAYRSGEVDAVTNAAFEPLALKLLAPYKDFRRATYGALTYYSFNLARAPFDDVRVREALAIALDRDRLCADTMGGATEPAKRFLPEYKEQTKTSPRDNRDAGESSVGAQSQAETESKEGTAAPSGDLQPGDSRPDDSKTRDADDVREDVKSEQVKPLEADAERARRLLAEAGFPDGANFPRIRLLVNRNDQHRVMAQAVAAMWRNVLGIETEVVVRNWDEYEAALWTGDYDIARRSIVMQTLDEESNMRAMFAREQEQRDASETAKTNGAEASASPAAARVGEEGQGATEGEAAKSTPAPILSEAQALRELPAIPVYFASSYALVKPYVRGFEANLLDVPSLKHVRLDTDWKPPAGTEVIRVVSNR